MKKRAATNAFGVAEVGVNKSGFTLVEILAVVLLLAVAIVPMLNAFAPAGYATRSQEEVTIFGHRAQATLARVTALEFDALEAHQGDPVDLAALFGWPDGPKPAEAAREAFSYTGTTVAPEVAILDSSGGTGGLLEVRVSVGDITLRTLRADY